ncbi:ricin-type beta-trefoil lectin domain protein [Streptomyces sp. CWNU-52B]|uniref:ricin-type beta-trefoil lectin domain protein n=1 Tax=unclassified Streptomyces TaxID=2593676 RepID=UPI0039C23137
MSAESGTDSEETTATTAAATAVEPATVPESRPEPRPEAEAEPAEAKAEAETAAEPPAAKAGADSEPDRGAASSARPEAEAGSDAHPEAAAEAKSRLPALVRTVTATAIGKPQQTGPVGRPGKAVLAGAAIGGVLLVSVPLLLLGGHDNDERSAPTAAETVLNGNPGETPGDFAVTEPDASASQDAEKDSGKSKQTVQEAPASAVKSEGASKKPAADKDPSKKQSDGKKSDGDKDEPAKGGSGVTFSAPVSLRSHLSGRCLDVPGGDFSDGKQLFVWDCNNGEAQKWRFASDGTIRIKDKCLDVADANFNDGTRIQIAWCSGNIAQKFALNGSHDLVNTVVGKCVDIKDNNADSGAWLQLWSCNGGDNQKWSV